MKTKINEILDRLESNLGELSTIDATVMCDIDNYLLTKFSDEIDELDFIAEDLPDKLKDGVIYLSEKS